MTDPPPQKSLRERMHDIVFEADTRAGRAFDLSLIACILLSVGAVTLDSVASINARHGQLLLVTEWAFTVLFTLEYVLRLLVVRRPLNYAFSFFGLVDLLGIAPTYLSLTVEGTQSLLVIRALRLLRIFRVLKLAHLVGESQVLLRALRASRPKITVFVGSVVIITVIMGALMYVVEGPSHGFTSIPRGMYWAVVTLTTVGYGDLSPQTDFGQLLAAVVMIMGYGILAVPTGIVTVELAAAIRKPITTQSCPFCTNQGHDFDAVHCKYCGGKL
jgi:voltage-gated potassium channel